MKTHHISGAPRALLIAMLLLSLLSVPLLAAPLAHSPAQAAAPLQGEGVSEDNCTITPFDVAGQGNFTIQGSSGDSLPPGLARNDVLQPADPNLQLINQLGPNPVAILVIDDFFPYLNESAHGRLVADLLIEMIQGHPAYAFAPQQINRDPVIWEWNPAQGGGSDPAAGRVLVVEVDTQDFNTDELANFVRSAVDLVTGQYGVNRLVLNMSFALVPCSTPDYDLRASREARVPGQTVRTTVLAEIAQRRNLEQIPAQRAPTDIVNRSLADSPATRQAVSVLETYARSVQRRSAESGVLDPLHAYVQSLTGVDQWWNPRGDVLAVAVASAGNFGRNLDSFLPGYWPEVISASASLGFQNPWNGSNKGQVMLAGGVYNLNNVLLVGTSFSAPLLSMNMAFYLTRDPLCGQPPLNVPARFGDAPIYRLVNASCAPPFTQAAPPRPN